MIIALVNQKGGVGKTTTAVNMAAGLAIKGKRVLLVDLDPQGNASSGLGFPKEQIEQGVYEALLGLKTAKEVVREYAHHSGVHVFPATPDLAGANVELVQMENREMKLTEMLASIKGQYDVILIDCPPSLGLLTINGLLAADQVLIPVQAEYYALEGLQQLLQTIQLVKDNLKPELAVLGAVVTMFDRRNRLSEAVLQELQKFFPGTIFSSIIPRNVRLAEAPSHGKSIFHYDDQSPGARAYEKLAEELVVMLEQASSASAAIASTVLDPIVPPNGRTPG